ncbi:MAG: alpha/beta hydrolase [Terriglobus sp.]
MNVTTANGVKLAYDSFGNQDHPVMLLIAGLGTQRTRWPNVFCEGLAQRGYRVIRFDNRDAGESTHFTNSGVPDFNELRSALMAGRKPTVPYALTEMALDAVELLDQLSIERAHVVGRSMGGMIAQIIASEHPSRVLSLTSIMSSTGNPALPQAAPDIMAMMMQPPPDPFVDLEGFIANQVAFARRIAGTGYVFDEPAHRAIVLEELRRSYDPAGTARQIAATGTAGDRRERLRTITAPTLVIHGTDDPLIPPACGEDTAASIPHARLMLVEGMGHEIPPEFCDVILDAIHRIAS